MHNSEAKKYSIVSYVNGDTYDKIHVIQKNLAERTGSWACLESWTPHVTIGTGILVGSEQQENLEFSLQRFVSKQKVFDVELSGFGGTSTWPGAITGRVTPYVLWVDVVMNDNLSALFQNLAREITNHYDVWLPRIVNYVPHVTLAFSDLSEKGYEAGKHYLEKLNFLGSMHIDHLSLVENFPGKGIEYQRFPFG